MERKRYLEMCQQATALKANGDTDLPENLKVEYKHIIYWPYAYTLSFRKDGSVRHTAVLHDLKANSITSVPLDAVKEYDRKGRENKNDKT